MSKNYVDPFDSIEDTSVSTFIAKKMDGDLQKRVAELREMAREWRPYPSYNPYAGEREFGYEDGKESCATDLERWLDEHFPEKK